ncbi:hypothetical protein NA57DRAFT_57264 [Rhizodiscina lignyota]|uniref:Uncharacterized protein n=1 Tax=Rhizodiscina lignyota TaxID=1504668 RepID=A0A9P4IC64_9PEZI|nr:hypothetical protein NA57DRAFT_57264 [Rhizodiscina lignyota]
MANSPLDPLHIRTGTALCETPQFPILMHPNDAHLSPPCSPTAPGVQNGVSVYSRRLSTHIASLLAEATRTAATRECIPPAHLPTSKGNLMSAGAAAEMEATMARLSLDSNTVPRVRMVKVEKEGDDENSAAEKRKSMNKHRLRLSLSERRTSI